MMTTTLAGRGAARAAQQQQASNGAAVSPPVHLRVEGLLEAVAVISEPSHQLVTISNIEPRLSADGEIVNAHDGTVRWLDGKWYMHAAQYGLCADPPNHGCGLSGPTRALSCGFQPNHNVSIWSSANLSSGSWHFEGQAVQCTEAPHCSILYRPHLVWNPNTELYVLFWNFVNHDGGPPHKGNAAATASSPAGPFTIASPLVNTSHPSGDFDVFVDKDGRGYMIYSGEGHLIFLEQLTPDFLNGTGIGAEILGGNTKYPPLTAFPIEFVEAPVLFERRRIYYALFGHCCCFCYQGSGMFVFQAPHPLGPWKQQQGSADLGCINGTTPTPAQPAWGSRSLPLTAVPSPGQGCLHQNATQASATRAQQNFVVQIETASGETEYIWTGDRWMQAPDGIKGHEPQFWGKLEFDAAGNVLPLKWKDTISIDIKRDQGK
jgi:hypothetical protein